jgi:DNA-binding CsgD family transcriptional regulator
MPNNQLLLEEHQWDWLEMFPKSEPYIAGWQNRADCSHHAVFGLFERDLVRERVCSGLAAAKAEGKKLGRKPGQRVKADKYESRVLQMVTEGHSYRQIAQKLHLSKTTINEIVKRDRQMEKQVN